MFTVGNRHHITLSDCFSASCHPASKFPIIRLIWGLFLLSLTKPTEPHKKKKRLVSLTGKIADSDEESMSILIVLCSETARVTAWKLRYPKGSAAAAAPDQ